MADNFLERRMEDFRSGKLSVGSPLPRTSSGARPGFWSVRFPPRKVTVAVTPNFFENHTVSTIRSVTEKLANLGSKVDLVYRGNLEDIPDFGPSSRIYLLSDKESPVELGDVSRRLLETRRDVDVLLLFGDAAADVDFMESFCGEWLRYRDALPYPNEYGGRVIAVSTGDGEMDCHSLSLTEGMAESISKGMAESMSKLGITFNRIESADPESIMQRILFLMLPSSGSLNDVTL